MKLRKTSEQLKYESRAAEEDREISESELARFAPDRVRMWQRDAERDVRAYQVQIEFCARLDSALRVLGLKENKWRLEARRCYELLQIARADAAEFAAALEDFAGHFEFAHDYVRVRTSAAYSPETPRDRKSDGLESSRRKQFNGYYGERMAIHRERRRKHLERLGAEKFEMPAVEMTQQEAFVFVRERAESCRRTLRSMCEDLYSCKSCEAQHAFRWGSMMELHETGLGGATRPCDSCRGIVAASDTVKRDLEILTGGAESLCLARYGIARGRPRKNKV